MISNIQMWFNVVPIVIIFNTLKVKVPDFKHNDMESAQRYNDFCSQMSLNRTCYLTGMRRK